MTEKFINISVMQYCVKYFSTEMQLEIVSSRSRVDSILYPNIRSRVRHIMYTHTYIYAHGPVGGDASETREGMVNGHAVT